MKYSPFITLLIINTDLDITWSHSGSHFFYHGILQRNYRKMTIIFLKILCKITPLYHDSLITQSIPMTHEHSVINRLHSILIKRNKAIQTILVPSKDSNQPGSSTHLISPQLTHQRSLGSCFRDDSLSPNRQFFSHVRMFPWLNKY